VRWGGERSPSSAPLGAGLERAYDGFRATRVLDYKEGPSIVSMQHVRLSGNFQVIENTLMSANREHQP